MGLFGNLITYILYIIFTNQNHVFGTEGGLEKSYGIIIFYILLTFYLCFFILINSIYYSYNRYINPKMKDSIRSLKAEMSKEDFENFLIN